MEAEHSHEHSAIVMRGVVMVEERSAHVAVEAIAAGMGLSDRIVVVPHDGKADLERSFVRKIVGWHHPGDVRFLVSRDNDGADCQELKTRLLALVPPLHAPRVKIRLVMQELESWYLGELEAVSAAGLIDEAVVRRRKIGDPYRLTNASEIFGRLCSYPGKIGAARLIGPHLSLVRNRSQSFKNFLSALAWVAEDTVG